MRFASLITLSWPFPFHQELHQAWKFSFGREVPAQAWWLLKSLFWTIKISARKLCHLYSLLGGCWTADWKESLQTSRAISEIRRQNKKECITKRWIFHLHTFSFLLHFKNEHFSLVYRFIVENWREGELFPCAFQNAYSLPEIVF